MQKLTVLLTVLVLLSAWGKPIATAQGMTTNVINGGNLRTEPRLAPETILGQVCPGDQVEVLTQQQALGALWYRVRITNTVLDCHPKRVPLNSEGWLSSSLLAPPQLGTPSSLPSPNPTAPSSSPTPTAPSSPASLLSVIQRGSLRTEIVLTPKTVIGEVCPGGIVELMGQQQALGELWYRVRLTKMGPACADKGALLGKEGWLNSALVGPFQTPTPTRVLPSPTATSAALSPAGATASPMPRPIPTATSAALSPAGAIAAGDSPPASSSIFLDMLTVLVVGLCVGPPLLLFFIAFVMIFAVNPYIERKKKLFELESKIPGKPLPEGEVLTTAEASMLIDLNLNYSDELVKLALKELLLQQMLELRTEEHIHSSYSFLDRLFGDERIRCRFSYFLQTTPGALERLPRESPLYSVLKALADYGENYHGGELVFSQKTRKRYLTLEEILIMYIKKIRTLIAADHSVVVENVVFDEDEMEFSVIMIGGGEDGLPPEGVALQKLWDDLSNFKNHIRNHLVNRGLLEEWEYEPNQWFGKLGFKLVKKTHYKQTQSGEAVSLRLKAQLDQARFIPQLLENNPAQATELILSLGNHLLLVNELKPHYTRLASSLHNQQYSILKTFDKILVNISIPPPPSDD